MDAKKALVEVGSGDIEKAIEFVFVKKVWRRQLRKLTVLLQKRLTGVFVNGNVAAEYKC